MKHFILLALMTTFAASVAAKADDFLLDDTDSLVKKNFRHWVQLKKSFLATQTSKSNESSNCKLRKGSSIEPVGFAGENFEVLYSRSPKNIRPKYSECKHGQIVQISRLTAAKILRK